MNDTNDSALMNLLEPLAAKYGADQLRMLMDTIDPPVDTDGFEDDNPLIEERDSFIDRTGNATFEDLDDHALRHLFTMLNETSHRAWQAHPEAYLLLLPVPVIRYMLSFIGSAAMASDRRQPRPCVNHPGFYIDEDGMMYKFVNGEFVECDMELPDTGPIYFDHEAGMLEPDPRRELFETFIGPVQKNWRIVPRSGDYAETGLEELLISIERQGPDNLESLQKDFRVVPL